MAVGATRWVAQIDVGMRLGIDLRCLPADGSPGSGVAHAAREITRAIIADGRVSVVTYVHRESSFDRKNVELDGTRRSDLVRGLKQRPCDVLFVPSGAVSPGIPVQVVPWVHDVDIFDHPEWFPQSWLKRTFTTSLFLRGIRRAPHVFAVSEYTKQTLLRLVPDAKVTVTGEGGDTMLADMKNVQPPRPFVLVLGTVEPRKNIELVCDIWPEVAARVPGVDLVIAGRDGWKTGPINAAMDRCQGIIRRTDVSDDVRRDLLLSASLVLVPSWSEGFGLVALEAIQVRTPVLASNRGALPEVVGQGEWLLDPADRDIWRNKTVELLSDPAARQRVLDGQSAAKTRWTWARAAESILDHLPNIE